MLEWDKRVINLAQENKLKIFSYARHVDDTANCMAALPPGTREMVFLISQSKFIEGTLGWGGGFISLRGRPYIT